MNVTYFHNTKKSDGIIQPIDVYRYVIKRPG